MREGGNRRTGPLLVHNSPNHPRVWPCHRNGLYGQRQRRGPACSSARRPSGAALLSKNAPHESIRALLQLPMEFAWVDLTTVVKTYVVRHLVATPLRCVSLLSQSGGPIPLSLPPRRLPPLPPRPPGHSSAPTRRRAHDAGGGHFERGRTCGLGARGTQVLEAEGAKVQSNR